MNKKYKFDFNVYISKPKDLKWWIYLVFTFVFAGFLIGGAYWGILIDYWYVSKENKNASWLNFDLLMSYLSVQVNLITIIWMFLFVLVTEVKQTDKKTNWYRAIINLNLLMFIIFWAGIIGDFLDDFNTLSNYVTSQIVCTIMTHFICPLFLMIMYCFEKHKQKLYFSKTIISKELMIVYIYLIFYLLYVLIRANIYTNFKDMTIKLKAFLKWPYFFMDLDKPMFGLSRNWFLVTLIVAFLIWGYVNQIAIVILNNLSIRTQSYIRIRKIKNQTLWS